MKHLKRSLSSLSVTAVVLATAACSSSTPKQANNPSQSPTMAQYGEPASQAAENAQTGVTSAQGSGREMNSAAQNAGGQVSGSAQSSESSVENALPKTGAQGSTTGAGNKPIDTWGNGATSTPGDVGVTNPMAGGDQGQIMDVSTLNDAQLAAVVSAINSGEIGEAQLALQKATSSDVKRFARDMMTAHRDMQTKATQLLTKLQITPSENAVSNQLKSDAQTEMATLQTMRGKDFDRDYIDSQVRNHNKALELLDRMIPNVKNSEFKAALTNDRPMVEAHLRAAERVQQTLQHGSTNQQPNNP